MGPPAVSWPATTNPKSVPGLPELNCSSIAPVAILTSQMLPDVESPVQKSLPFGSRFSAKSNPEFPGREYVLMTDPLPLIRTASELSAANTSPARNLLKNSS